MKDMNDDYLDPFDFDRWDLTKEELRMEKIMKIFDISINGYEKE